MECPHKTWKHNMCVCVCVRVHLFVTNEDIHLYNDTGMSTYEDIAPCPHFSKRL